MNDATDGNRSPWRIALLSLLSLSLACLMLWGMMMLDQRLTWLDGGLMLNQAEYLDSNAATPPGADRSWQYTGIPDEWNRHPHAGNSVWYRFRLTVAAPPHRLWGIYLPVIRQNASVWLNGELLGDGGSFEQPLARNWNRPLYFSIPRGLIAAGENLLLVRIKSAYRNDGLLAPVFLAPADFLYPGYRLKFFFRYTLLQFIIITLMFSTLLLYALTWLRPSDRLYAWYALPLTVFLIYSLKYVVVEPPIDEAIWDSLMMSALLWFPVLASSFIQRFIGHIDRRIERLLYWSASLVTLALFLTPQLMMPEWTSRFIASTALLLGLYPVYRLLCYLIDRPRRDTFLLMTSGFLMTVFGVHDWLVATGLTSRLEGFFLPYSIPPGLLLFVYILMRRFVNAMNESEHLNRHLQSAIQRKHRELEQSFEHMKELERRNAVSEERARLMRDMHDGMGGHLVSLLGRVEDERSSNADIARELRAALDDLRLMIDSMEDTGGDLLALMAMLRDRLEPRLKTAGIRLAWQARDIPALDGLSPEKSLHILRIFQEAITNVLKHAGARLVTIELCCQSDEKGNPGILISCRDDGRGFDRGSQASGRGLWNIKRRAEFLGGQSDIESKNGAGCLVWLWLPRVCPLIHGMAGQDENTENDITPGRSWTQTKEKCHE